MIASGILALTAVAGPVLVPYAATLAAPRQRGAVTGTVMSGVLFGVLASRTAGGLIAQVAGWRAVFALAAIVTLALAVILWRLLPPLAPADHLRYGALLRSVVRLVREEPVLRVRSAYGFLGFGTFTVLWTSIAFQLSRPPYSFNEAWIGLAGLAGVAGAMAARVAGRATDALLRRRMAGGHRGRCRVLRGGTHLVGRPAGFGSLARSRATWAISGQGGPAADSGPRR